MATPIVPLDNKLNTKSRCGPELLLLGVSKNVD